MKNQIVLGAVLAVVVVAGASGCAGSCRPESGVSAGAETETTADRPGPMSFPTWDPPGESTSGTVVTSGPGTATESTAAADADTTVSGGSTEHPGGETSNSSAEEPAPASSDTDPASSSGADIQTCGNGYVDFGEECDDGTDNDRDGVDGCNACLRTARFAFVTSATYTGAVLTQEWADSECAVLGKFAGYVDIPWRAWLSDEVSNAGERVGASKLPYILLSGVGLAGSAAELSAPKLLAPFNADELGTELATGMGLSCDETDALVWTFTAPSGELGVSCSNSIVGTVGNMNAVDEAGGWTAMCDVACETQAHLYCVEWAP